MDSKDAYDIALKIGDLYFKALQFFITICTLFGGWIVVKGLPSNEENARLYLAVAFAASTGTLVMGQVSLLRRADAAITLSRKRLETSVGPVSPEVDPMFDITGSARARYVTIFGMLLVIVAIIVLIFKAQTTGDLTDG